LETNISTDEQPIIGTSSLGPCVGVLIYSKKHKKSIVFHASTEWKPLILETLIILAENHIISAENFDKALKTFELFEKYDLYHYNADLKEHLIAQNGLNITDVEESLEVTIIPGYYQNHYDVAKNITSIFSSLNPLSKIRTNPIPKKAVRIRMVGNLGSHEFFFNSQTGKFVTEKVLDLTNIKNYRL
jgi:hypothetical protein